MTTSITFRMIDFKMFLPFDNGLTDGLTNGHTLVVVKSLSRLKRKIVKYPKKWDFGALLGLEYSRFSFIEGV